MDTLAEAIDADWPWHRIEHEDDRRAWMQRMRRC